MAERADVLAGGLLHYEVAGSGDPIVLLHGMALDARMWDGEVERFADEHEVVRYDLRGFGRSSLPTGPYAHTDDLAALLALLGIARAHVVGHGMGGAVAVDFALTHPATVRSLILVDTIVGGFAWPQNGAEMSAVWQAGKRDGVEAARTAWLASPLFAPAMRQPAVADRLRAMVGGYSGWHFVNDDPHRALQPPAWERLGEIAAPTLVLAGALDLPDFRTMSAHVRQAIAGSRGEVVDGAGHMLSMEAPARFHQLVADFLGDVPA